MRNINLTNGLIFSQVLLLELSKKGISREKSYSLVQANALECWKTKIDFKELVLADNDIGDLLSMEELESIFSFDRYTKRISRSRE